MLSLWLETLCIPWKIFTQACWRLTIINSYLAIWVIVFLARYIYATWSLWRQGKVLMIHERRVIVPRSWNDVREMWRQDSANMTAVATAMSPNATLAQWLGFGMAVAVVAFCLLFVPFAS